MTMDKPQWTQVGDHFAELGKKVKEHYDREQTDPIEVHDALGRVSETARCAFDALGEAARDKGVHDQARTAFKSLADAIDATIRDLKERAQKRTE
jgi:hypothetical protein